MSSQLPGLVEFLFFNDNTWRNIDNSGTKWSYRSYTMAFTSFSDHREHRNDVVEVILKKVNAESKLPLECIWVEGRKKIAFEIEVARVFQFVKFSKMTFTYSDSLQKEPALDSIYSDLMIQAKNGDEITLLSNDGLGHTMSKFIFTSRSNVFSCMLSTPMIEKETQIIKMNINSKLMKALIHFLNTDKIIYPELKYDLAILGDKYDLPLLVRLCEDALVTTLNQANFFHYCSIATKYSCVKLLGKITEFIKENSLNAT